jgi:hypothetical protein
VKQVVLLILGIVASGCVRTSQEKQTMVTAPTTQPYYAPRAAAALAFDPPIASNDPLPSFSRVGRSPAAFAGYEEQTVEYHQLYQRDQQNTDRGDRLDRQAYTVRSSVTVR